MSYESPLVSVIVITYNSSAFILETLESINKQTYRNIELVITDDCSKDDTIEICNNWIEKNKANFVRVELITTTRNTGIPGNCNRGLYAATGKWIKLIAGDDILLESCINDYILFVDKNPCVKVVYSKFLCFETNLSDHNISLPDLRGYENFYAADKTSYQQFRILLRRNFAHGPTLFIDRELLLSVGGFDEKYKFEDLPLALKITNLGFKIYFLEKNTVYYRINNPSITNSKLTDKLFSNFYKSKYDFDKEWIFPNASFLIVLFKKYEYYRLKILEDLGFNRNCLLCRILYKISYCINPLNTYNKYF